MKKDSLHHPAAESAPPDRNDPGASASGSGLPQEKKEMSARFLDARMDEGYPGDPVQGHSHPFHELVYCLTGGGEYQIGPERIIVSRGDILSVPAGVFHTLAVPETAAEPYRRYILRISPDFILLIQSVFSPDAATLSHEVYALSTAGTAWEPLGEYFRRCVQECEQKQLRWETAVFGITTELVAQLARAWHGTHDSSRSKPELLDRILSYLEAHLSEKITLQDIAARFWVSQSTISQLFRKKMGVSFYRYVTMRRLSEAQMLIRNGIPMDQVSISVGFQDYSTFYRAFRAEYGISPAQYRKNHLPG